MKTKHILRSTASLALALLICTSFPMAALAESETIANDDGTSTVVTTTTGTSTDAEGNITVTVTIEKDTSGTLNDGSGAVIDRNEIRVETKVSNEDGTVIQEHFVEDGKETKSHEEADTGSEAGQPEAEVALRPGESTSGNAVSTEISGDTPKGEDDKNYDYTETTTTQREVSATTGEVSIESSTGELALEPVAPESLTQTRDDGTTVQNQGFYEDGTKKLGIYEDKDHFDRFGYDIVKEVDEETGEVCYKLYSGSTEVGYLENWKGDYQYCGYGDDSTTSVKYEILTYEMDEDGNKVLDENGDPVIKTSRNSADTIQFALQDKEGNLVYAYCVDLETSTSNGAFYDVANLEDNSYYADEESEAHIRAIVTNGYWGTSEGTGSLDNIKAGLKDALTKGTVPNTEVQVPKYDENGAIVKDEEGNTVMETKKLSELVDGLTEGEALAVTQAAIWSWSNGAKSVDDGSVGERVVGLGGWGTGNQDRMDALYTYLMGLTDDGKKESTVIDENSFLAEDGLKLIIGDKAEGHANNSDDNTDNDVYNADLNFRLAFVPGEKDDLLVQISYEDLDGNTVNVVRRLAGENSEGQSYEAILPEEDGSYILRDLVLSENEDFKFDLRLEGTQHLEQGVYVYSPVGGRDASQTFVGMAEGERDVDVSIGVTVKFDVDENDKVVAKRVWHSEGGIGLPEADPEEEQPGESPVTIIGDELVPLAKAPDTGSFSAHYAVAASVSGMGLAGLSLVKKNKEDE